MIDEMNYISGGYCANLPPLWYFCLPSKVGKTGEPRELMRESDWPDVLKINEIVHYDSRVC
jgi:hypothetical protein